MHYLDEDRVQMIEHHLELLEIEMGSIVSDFEESEATEEEWNECERKYKKVQQQASLIRNLLYPSVGYVLDVKKEI